MTDEQTATKCSVQDGWLHPCAGMDRLIEGRANAHRKGVTLMVLTNLSTMETTRTAAVLRSGEHRTKGILMNFCPMCGAHITPHFPETSEVERD